MFVPVVPRRMKVGKTDRVYFEIDKQWLDGELIASATVATSDPFITIGAQDISDNQIGFMATGVSVGTSVVSANFLTTGGRSDCKHIKVVTEDC